MTSSFVTGATGRASPGYTLVPPWQPLHIRTDASGPEDGDMGFFMLCVGASVVAVQDPQATVTGTVTNAQSHEPIVGLVVTLTDLGRAARTDSAGRYIFRQAPPGPHHVAVRYLGFTPRTLHAIVPSHGTLEINVALVPVEMHLPALLVRHTQIDRTVGGKRAASFMNDQQHSITEIRSDPRYIEPDVLQSVTRGDVVTRPESPNGLYVRGGAAAHVAYALDGIPVFSPYHTSGMFSAWSPDAIAGMELSSTLPSPGDAASLSGTVAGITRSPALRMQSSASLSTTQARFALDGPLRWRGGGFLLSVRSGFPSVGVPASDESYIRGGSSDRIAKVEVSVLGGRLRLLNYSSEDDVNTSAGAEEPSTTRVRRNAFEWSSGSMGAEWTGAVAGTHVRTLTWRAASDASAQWPALRGPLQLDAARRDEGLLVDATRNFTVSSVAAGVRLERSGTAYHVDFQPDSVRDSALESATFVVTGFARYQATLAERATITAGNALALFNGQTYISPQAQLQWQASKLVSLAASYARRHQFAQSLRNEESMAGSVFPADLYLGAGPATVPVARSQHIVLAADYRPIPAVRLGAQVYTRRFHDIVLVAPVNGDPFSTGSRSTGQGVSHGASVDASVSTARARASASYGLQNVRFTTGSTSYSPSHGSTHVYDGGILLFPTPTLSVRVGASGSAGRRTTNVRGGFEWEACNLRDRGCEFGGTPRSDTAAIGRSTLPAYLRADVGVTKHWHFQVGSRDAVIALFGAVTNVFGRRNLLTFSREELSGTLVPIEMRPFAPLVVGLEWKY